ncbi:MAG: hypothetical protein ACYSTL_02180 [Planctomycetota bacterium]|jgi:hypothetical protein
MNVLADIEVGPLINFIIVVVVAVVIVLSKIAEKKMREYGERQSEKWRREREAQEQAAPQPPQVTPQQPAIPQQAPPVSPQPPQPVRPYQRPAQQPVPQAQPVPGPVRMHIVTAPQKPPLAPPRPLAPPAPKRPRSVEDEIARLRSRLGNLERLRKQRLAVHIPDEADTEAIESRLVSIRPAIGSKRRAVPRIAAATLGVNLSDPLDARDAIVFHEIFSSPKALRQTPEIWET